MYVCILADACMYSMDQISWDEMGGNVVCKGEVRNVYSWGWKKWRGTEKTYVMIKSGHGLCGFKVL
jgi:hypothetical protein